MKGLIGLVLVFIAIIAVLFLSHLAVLAAAPTATPAPLAINCGIAGDPASSKCCEDQLDFQKVTQDAQQSVSNFGFGILNPVVGAVGGALGSSGNTLKDQLGLNQLSKQCYLGNPDTTTTPGSCICVQSVTPTVIPDVTVLCNRYANANEKAFCDQCAKGGAILTGLGCIPLNVANFISDFLLSRLVGLAGILGLFCIIYAAFTLQTSRGNPEKIKKAQELLTSCIMGLMLIIFSVFILRVIGVDILKLPGLGK